MKKKRIRIIEGTPIGRKGDDILVREVETGDIHVVDRYSAKRIIDTNRGVYEYELKESLMQTSKSYGQQYCRNCGKYKPDKECKHDNVERILRLEKHEPCPFWVPNTDGQYAN